MDLSTDIFQSQSRPIPHRPVQSDGLQARQVGRQVGGHGRTVSITWVKQQADDGSAVGHVDPQSPHFPGQTDYGLQLRFVEDALMGAGAQGGQCL